MRLLQQHSTAAVACLLLLAVSGSHAKCPFHFSGSTASPDVIIDHYPSAQRTLKQFDAKAVENLDWNAVKADLTKFMTDSQPLWPADDGHYGGLMIRLAWHAAGSYRKWDGRGGAEGGRQRFFPEGSWPDNANLDKARHLLVPIKQKYGDALSWGDLIALAGTVAIESMGGPQMPFCAGRVDDADGTASLALGPTPLQKMVSPCTAGDGNCEQPLGATTMGLIYVNPEGVMGVPIPQDSVPQIRSTFEQMGMDDQETVALIGGGHAFGKVHGACPAGVGPAPVEDPKNSPALGLGWPGKCGSGPLKGKGPNTFTSGFEGPWTTSPSQWDNEFFRSLLQFDWEKHKGPGGHWQWRPVRKAGRSDSYVPNIMMLTSDVALLHDPIYLKHVEFYASNLTALTEDFGKAWYKLMTRDMGPVTRCLGKLVAPAQPWQLPLPAPPAQLPDFAAVKRDILYAMRNANNVIEPDMVGGKPCYGALFSHLAYQCASTFRQTDHSGGCNGARIRFAPQKHWTGNKGVDKILEVLRPVKRKYANLSWADLIVLAGTTAVEQAAADADGYKFCGGRTDAADAAGTEHLAPRNYTTVAIKVRDNMVVQGLTPQEGVVLAARPRSPQQQKRLGWSGSWTNTPNQLSNEYFKVLLNNKWQKVEKAGGGVEFKAEGKDLYMMPSDLVLLEDPEYLALVKEYAADNNKFLADFKKAWTKVMNADRFKGPVGSVCE